MLPEYTGRHCRRPMKQVREVALIGATNPVGDLGNGQVGLAQQRLGAFNPARDQVLMRGDPG
jgi:hypothetical protein